MIGFSSYNVPIPWGSRVLGASPQKALDVHLVFSDVNIDHVLEAYDLFLRLRKESPVLPLEERAFCGFPVFGVENWQVPWWNGVRTKASPHVCRIWVDCFHPVHASDCILIRSLTFRAYCVPDCPTLRTLLRGHMSPHRGLGRLGDLATGSGAGFLEQFFISGSGVPSTQTAPQTCPLPHMPLTLCPPLLRSGDQPHRAAHPGHPERGALQAANQRLSQRLHPFTQEAGLGVQQPAPLTPSPGARRRGQEALCTRAYGFL